MRKLLLLSSCLILLLMVNNAGAQTFTTWDPQGTTGGNPYTGSLSGSWEGANWSTSQSGQATPGNWVEGTAALFAVNSGAGTPTFTVTMNANHTIAGIYNGPEVPNPCPVIINGTGVMTLTSGNLFRITSDSGDLGSVTINNAIAGTAGLYAAGTGSVSLLGINTYSGGTYLGNAADELFVGSYSIGTLFFNAADSSQPGICTSFGTGAIWISNCNGGVLNVVGSSAVTVTNAVNLVDPSAFTSSAVLYLEGNPAGVTFSGPWATSGAPGSATHLASLTVYSTGNNNNIYNDVVNISGVISGTNKILFKGNDIMELTGQNTYSGGTSIAGAGAVEFGNNKAFGTGTVTWTVSGYIAPVDANAYTIANAMVFQDTVSTFAGNAGGVTFSGAWNLGTSGQLTFDNIASTITVSGVMSGTVTPLTFEGTSWNLTGKNAFTSASMVINTGTSLTVAGAGDLNKGSYAGAITDNGTFTYGSSVSQILSGDISGSGTLAVTNGILTLSADNAYGGATTISGGTLALGSGGSINSTPAISIGAGGTFDVSAVDPFALSGGTTLSASGSASPATINDSAPGGTINLGSQSITLNYDGSHPAIAISSGTLVLNNNAFTVNTASPLAPGTYAIVQQNGGSIASTGACSVSGSAIAGGDLGIISVNGATVNLTITANPSPSPGITGVSVNGTTLTLMATNGSPNGLYVVLQSADVTLPLNQWMPVATNYFDVNGNINLSTNIVNPGTPQEFYGIQAP